jgi:catechol 2,3-dioxygenase-like lactoylglutathione lyase family enzyme
VRIEGLVFAGIATADLAAMASFFRDVLGADAVEQDGWHRVAFPNGSSLALVPPDWVSPPSDTNLGFLVDDVEAATRELAARGLDPDGELITGEGLRYRHFRAPDGRVFELIERCAG